MELEKDTEKIPISKRLENLQAKLVLHNCGKWTWRYGIFCIWCGDKLRQDGFNKKECRPQ
jgi:hypothetical protein